ncbi:hypothetical protein CC86DRAFT_142876 [Ophiobolus disseminans]|uniref:Uncharacterized protein n=1 Tax=Ophiobolus disseminans TaxID=1469910 RepID=A0A6A7AEZ7_9PLEO|nr:hypothetical protein CC86DRAFT_142876 [Ophiobolus disseminans]
MYTFTFKNPFSSYRGPSPLRHEYKIPGSWPSACDTPLTPPSTHPNTSPLHSHNTHRRRQPRPPHHRRHLPHTCRLQIHLSPAQRGAVRSLKTIPTTDLLKKMS